MTSDQRVGRNTAVVSVSPQWAQLFLAKRLSAVRRAPDLRARLRDALKLRSLLYARFRTSERLALFRMQRGATGNFEPGVRTLSGFEISLFDIVHFQRARHHDLSA